MYCVTDLSRSDVEYEDPGGLQEKLERLNQVLLFFSFCSHNIFLPQYSAPKIFSFKHILLPQYSAPTIFSFEHILLQQYFAPTILCSQNILLPQYLLPQYNSFEHILLPQYFAPKTNVSSLNIQIFLSPTRL